MTYHADAAVAAIKSPADAATRHQLLSPARAVAFLATLLYAFGLREGYVYHIAPILHFQGEVDLLPPFAVSVVMTIVAAIPALTLPLRSNGPSLLIAWLAYLLIFVPSCIVPIHATNYDTNGYILFIFFLGLNAIALAWMAQRRFDFSGGFLRLKNERLYIVIVGTLAVAISAYVWSVLGIQVELTDSIDDLYEYREAIFDRIWLERLLFTGYMLQLQSNAVLPVLTALALARRRW